MKIMQFFYRGSEFYQVLEKYIVQAKQEILINVYGFHNDVVGWRIARVLKDASRRGVKVRIIFDALGSWGDKQELAEEISRGGGEVKIFRPGKYFFRHPASFFHRNHARIILIDRKIFGLGGLGIGEVYLNREDLFVLLAVNYTEKIVKYFDYLWNLGSAWGFVDVGKNGLAPFPIATGIDAYISGARRAEAKIYEWFLEACRNAKRRIVLATAWFFPPFPLFLELLAAQKRGVQICVITPFATDRAYYDDFRALPIFGMLGKGLDWFPVKYYFHQKYYLFDDWWCLGSANFDIVSLRRNYELNIVGRGGEVWKTLEQNAALLEASTRPFNLDSVPLIFRKFNSQSYRFLDFLMSAREILFKWRS